jgi:hypothetical protein
LPSIHPFGGRILDAEALASHETGGAVRSTDFLLQVELDGTWMEPDPPAPVFNEELVKALREGPVDGVGDESAAVALLDFVHDQLQAYGTDGSEALRDPEIELAIRTLEEVVRRVGVRSTCRSETSPGSARTG